MQQQDQQDAQHDTGERIQRVDDEHHDQSAHQAYQRCVPREQLE